MQLDGFINYYTSELYEERGLYGTVSKIYGRIKYGTRAKGATNVTDGDHWDVKKSNEWYKYW